MQIHILVLYHTQISPSKRAFYWFYKELIDYLLARGYDASLHFCYLERDQANFDATGYSSCELPEKRCFNTAENTRFVVDFMKRNDINYIFNLTIPEYDVAHFLLGVKKSYRLVKIVDLLHNRPDLVLFYRRNMLLNLKFKRNKTAKEKIISLSPALYLYLLKWIVRIRFSYSHRVSDRTVLLSDSYIDDYSRVIGRKSDRVVAIPNPLPLIRSCVEIENKKNQVIFVGNFTPIKAVQRLLSIWKKIESDKGDWRLVLVGDGEERQQCEKYVKDFQLQDVDFIGFVSDPISYIDHSSIICLVSEFEGLPTVFFEAMTVGVVPMCFDTFSACHELIEHERSGVIVEPFDVECYAKRLVELMKDDLKRREMGERAKIDIQKYSIEHIAEKWIRLFQSLN